MSLLHCVSVHLEEARGPSVLLLEIAGQGHRALISPEVVPVVVPADPFVFVEIQPPILVFVFPVFLVYPPPSSTSSRLIEVEGTARSSILREEAQNLTTV